jgi:hypothetical protein
LVLEKSGLDGPAIFKRHRNYRTDPSTLGRVEVRIVRILIILIMSKSYITPLGELR